MPFLDKNTNSALIKVCGMREFSNIKEISTLTPDLMGFIFYPPSSRNVAGLTKETIASLPKEIQAVAVFVDEDFENILKITNLYNFNIVQLHGTENPQFCQKLKEKGLKVIKAFRISENFDFSTLIPFMEVVDCFIFDARGKAPGGNGVKFNWKILTKYTFSFPFILSGGIGEEDPLVLKDNLPRNCIGVDLNSKFEIYPGKKDFYKLSGFIKNFRS